MCAYVLYSGMRIKKVYNGLNASRDRLNETRNRSLHTNPNGIAWLSLSFSRCQAIVACSSLRKRSSRSCTRRLSLLKRRLSRRKAQLVVILATVLLVNTRMPRQVWIFSRSSTWWELAAERDRTATEEL